MKKYILLAVILLNTSLIISQSRYKLVKSSFSPACGSLWGPTTYNAFVSCSEFVQGKMNTNNKTSYIGFLNPDIYAFPPVITSVKDVPHDQGLQVQVIWKRCGKDTQYEADKYYSLWRSDQILSREKTKEEVNRYSQKISMVNEFDDKSTSIYEDELTDKKNVFTNPVQLIEQAKKNPEKKYYWLIQVFLQVLYFHIYRLLVL